MRRKRAALLVATHAVLAVAAFVMGVYLPRWTADVVAGPEQWMVTTQDIRLDEIQGTCPKQTTLGGLLAGTPLRVRTHGPFHWATLEFRINGFRLPLQEVPPAKAR